MNTDTYSEGFAAFEMGLKKDQYPSELSKTERNIWRSGWQDAYHQEEKEKELSVWKQFSSRCPWHNNGCCAALCNHDHGNECCKLNCAPLYFLESFHG